jgi:hypothetical protein
MSYFFVGPSWCHSGQRKWVISILSQKPNLHIRRAMPKNLEPIKISQRHFWTSQGIYFQPVTKKFQWNNLSNEDFQKFSVPLIMESTLISWSVSQGIVTRMSRWLFSFVTLARPSRPFYALRATPKTSLNFGRSVGGSVGRSQGSHTNVTLPLQFRHPGPPFPTLLCPAGHPQNGLKFWLVGHGEVTRTLRCLFSFVTRARPSRPFYALRATPKTALNFGWSVGRSVTGKSHKRHAASSVLSPGPALPDPSTPCGPPPKRP